MKIDVLKYLQLRIAPVLYRRTVGTREIHKEKIFELSSEAVKPDEQMLRGEKGEIKIKMDGFEKKYSPRRLLLVLALSILTCGLLIKYLFLWFPGLHKTDMPLIASAMLIIFLSPVLYAFFYTPMVRQFNKLKRSEAMMRELALIDALTGLYNRRGFLTYADHLLKLSDRTQRGLILIYADLDNMKRINDDFGHEQGDRALVCIADVLKKTFRNSDVIARVGGDEFAILALEAKAESLDALRRRLNENLKRTKYNIDSMQKLTFSLGIIYYNPEKPLAIEDLLRKADRLMYEEKPFKITPRPSLIPQEDMIFNHRR